MKKLPKKYIHVNQAVIKRNRKTGANDPVITCKDYKTNQYGHEVVIYGADGVEVARVVYRPDKPLSCGAHVWVEVDSSRGNIEVIRHESVEQLYCGGIDNTCQQNNSMKTADDAKN